MRTMPALFKNASDKQDTLLPQSPRRNTYRTTVAQKHTRVYSDQEKVYVNQWI